MTHIPVGKHGLRGAMWGRSCLAWRRRPISIQAEVLPQPSYSQPSDRELLFRCCILRGSLATTYMSGLFPIVSCQRAYSMLGKSNQGCKFRSSRTRFRRVRQRLETSYGISHTGSWTMRSPWRAARRWQHLRGVALMLLAVYVRPSDRSLGSTSQACRNGPRSP